MQRLWAPWRMDYIGQSRRRGCFLCRTFRADPDRDRAHLVLQRGATCALIMNRYPYNNGHLMAAPYRHVAVLEALRPRESAELLALAARACRRLRAAMRAEGFNLGLNIGAAAGAGLKEHLHLHVVPRWNGDTNFMPVLADLKVIPQALLDLYDRLRLALR